ncbi:MAG: glycosyltransferase family 2 protein [Bryobacteraceae bacterium]
MKSLAPILVTYNSSVVIDACLQSLRGHPVVVVDNASSDDTCQRVREYPNARLIANASNRGFASAVNQAVCASDADAFLLLNPDAELLTELDTALPLLERYGLVTGRLLDDEGVDQRGFGIRRFPTAMSMVFEVLGLNKLWPSNPINARYRYLDRDLHKSGEVEQPAGAFLYFRRDVWSKLGGFDEDFAPIWFEDVDFCVRASEAGYPAWYESTLQAKHRGGHSILPLVASSRITYWYVSLLRYAAKHFRPVSFRGVCVAVILGAPPRLILDTFREGSLTPLKAYWKTIRFATLCLLTPSLARPALVFGGASRIRG